MTPLTVDRMREVAALNGFTFTAAELEPLRPAIEQVLALLARLETLPLGAGDPAVQYRIL